MNKPTILSFKWILWGITPFWQTVDPMFWSYYFLDHVLQGKKMMKPRCWTQHGVVYLNDASLLTTMLNTRTFWRDVKTAVVYLSAWSVEAHNCPTQYSWTSDWAWNVCIGIPSWHSVILLPPKKLCTSQNKCKNLIPLAASKSCKPLSPDAERPARFIKV